MNLYSPISCTFHDYIEHFITLKKEVRIVFEFNGISYEKMDIILETFTSETKEEFMRLKNFTELIRLDKIISIDRYNLIDYN